MSVNENLIAFTVLLKQYRQERGLSRTELATRVKKSPQYIAALENPRVAKTPSVETLTLIVQELGLKPEKRRALVDALLGIQNTPTRYDAEDVSSVLQNIVNADRAVSSADVSWLLAIQPKFDNAMLPSFIESLIDEQRRTSLSIKKEN
ncbi:MAG TPA: helix-turn-helix transcriptional regulator [Candidatus Andersenbacteria bacterium]|nr:helix-turn-helix transcriptional regulator [Candidatus Andersenbacteria bacterium]